jgi:hypothetical protein
MQSQLVTDPVELFTIEIKGNGEGGVISVLWEKTMASADFRLK